MTEILVTDDTFDPGDQWLSTLLEQASLQAKFVPLEPDTSAEEIIRHLRGSCASGAAVSHVAVLAGSEAYTRQVFESAPDLRHIARIGTGYDAIDLDAATAHGVVVTTTPGANDAAVADHAFGLMLTLAHGIARDDRAVRRGQWNPVKNADLSGKTLGVVGLGRVGRSVARRARCFSMRILAYEPHPDPAFTRDLGIELVSLEELARHSDFISLHAPLGHNTRKMIGARFMSLMKPGAFLINTARGGLVDEDALYDALRAGGIGGAGLDVRASEPPGDGRFARLENAVMTPHSASFTDGSWRNMWSMAIESVSRLLSDSPPEGMLNPEVWNRRRAERC